MVFSLVDFINTNHMQTTASFCDGICRKIGLYQIYFGKTIFKYSQFLRKTDVSPVVAVMKGIKQYRVRMSWVVHHIYIYPTGITYAALIIYCTHNDSLRPWNWDQHNPKICYIQDIIQIHIISQYESLAQIFSKLLRTQSFFTHNDLLQPWNWGHHHQN